MTYLSVGPRLQRRATNGIVVESIPLLKHLDRVLRVLLAPLQHLGRVIDPDPLAIHPYRRLRIIQHIIRIQHNQLIPVDHPLGNEVVEQAAQLRVPRLTGHEEREARDLIEGWDGTTVVARDTTARMPDEEGVLEAAEGLERDDGRVGGLGTRAEGE